MKEVEAIKCLMNNATCHLDEPRTMAINALKKQIPKKPIIVRNSMLIMGEFTSFICPCCMDKKWSCFYYQPLTFDKYCPVCGQAIDWSD